MARAALQLGVRDLAEMAKVSPATVVRFEASVELKERTVEAVQRALEAAGVEFIAENGGGAGVRLAKPALAAIGEFKEDCPVHESQPQSDVSLDRQIAEQETAIAEIPEHTEPSPEAGMAAMDKALAENDLIAMKNKRTRRKNAPQK